MNAQQSLIREIMIYDFELGHNLAVAAKRWKVKLQLIVAE